MWTLTKFYKIIAAQKWGLLLQFAIFIGLSILFSSFMVNDSTSAEEFSRVEDVEIAIFDRDQTILSETFVAFMNEQHKVVELEDSKEVWHDTVIFTSTNFVLEIPVGFTESFVNANGEIGLEYLTGGNSSEPFFVRDQVERYFGLLATYLAGGFEMMDALALTEEVMLTGVEIQVIDVDNEFFVGPYLYFRFLPISLLIVIAMATGGVFVALGKQDLTRRLESAPVSFKRRTLERIISCILFGFLGWLIFAGVTLVMFQGEMLEIENMLRLLMSLSLIPLGIAIAYVLSQFIETKQVLNTVIFSLIFLLAMPAGIMFDLNMMGDQVLNVARFMPLYWYTRVNEMMMFETAMDWTLFWQGFVIQLAFAAAMLAVGMVFSKEKRAKKG